MQQQLEKQPPRNEVVSGISAAAVVGALEGEEQRKSDPETRDSQPVHPGVSEDHPESKTSRGNVEKP